MRRVRDPAAVVLLLAVLAAGCGNGGTGGGAGGDGRTGDAAGGTVSSQSGDTVTGPPGGTITSQPGSTASIEATTVTDSTFEVEVLQSEKAVLVHFWAEWCGPCRRLAPVLEEIAGEHQDRLTLARLNVDENPEMPDRFEVKSIPTLSLFVDGVEKKQLTGTMSKSSIVSELAEFIS